MLKNDGAMWNEIFTVENICEYGRAGLAMSAHLKELFSKGYDSIVIPSRGSFPIFNAARSAWYIKARNSPAQEERKQQMLEIATSPLNKALVLPFSADPSDANQTSSSIRRYWAKVLSAIVRRHGRDPHLLFYRCVVEHLAKKEWSSVMPRRLPSPKFIFVDTVISGRAIAEIVDAFEEERLDQCHFMLILDQNGEGVKGPYRAKLARLESAGRCTQVTVKRLWTEDRGPAVSGVWSTVYPDIMQNLQAKYGWAHNAYGAGSFYEKVSSSQMSLSRSRIDPAYNMPVTVMYGTLSTLYFTALSVLQETETLQHRGLAVITEKRERAEQVMKHMLQELRRSIEEFGQLSPLWRETTKYLAEPRIHRDLATARVSVSGSHIVRVGLPEKDITEFFTTFERTYLRGNIGALDDAWFR